jgi:hypothetical protein
MRRLRDALEQLDEMISDLEDKLGLQAAVQRDALKKRDEQVKTSRAREANALAVSQKIATRLDRTIDHVERILRG